MIRTSLIVLILIVFDSLMIVAALFSAYFLRVELQSFLHLANLTTNVWHYALSGEVLVLALLMIYTFGLYTKRNDFWEEMRVIFKVSGLVLLSSLMIIFLDKSSGEYSRLVFLLFFVNMLWTLPLGRIASKKLMLCLGLWQEKIWVDADKNEKKELEAKFANNWYMGYQICETLSMSRIVFIMSNTYSAKELDEKIHMYKRSKKEVILIPNIYNLSFSHANVINLPIDRISLVQIQNQLFKVKNIFFKKFMELFLIFLMLPAIVVILSLLALIVKFDSAGTVFFRQKRLGKNEKEFVCYKFRSMYEDGTDKLQSYLKEHPDEKSYYDKYHKYKNDPRITPAGRWLRKLSLDELPQIINVLKGEMNLIGPRPYMIEEKDKIGEDVQTILHVAPGITGFWQVSGRNDVDFKQRVEMDTWYIQNWTLWLDFVIFLKTFAVLLNRKGAR